MASVDTGTNNPNDPNNPNNQAANVSQPGSGTNQPATTGGAGGVTSTGAGNVTGSVTGTANPSQPFQNISSYLAANAEGGKQLAGQVAGTVSQPITQAQEGITNAAQDFSKSVNAGYAPENKDLVSAVASNPAYVVAENPDNVTNFLGQLNNKYTGPTDFTQAPGYSDLQAKIAAAQSQAKNTENESGIQSLLGATEGPTTAGINKLDSLLLSTDPNNYKTIKDAGAGAANLLPTLNQTTSDQNAAAATGATTASRTAAQALEALNQARSAESTNLTSEQKSIEDIVNNYNQSVGVINPVVQSITAAIDEFFKNNPNVKMPDSGDPLADIKNLTSIVMPDLATYASPQDYAQIAALTQLGDTNVGSLPISSATSDKAQTFNVPTALQNAIGAAPGVAEALQRELTGIGGELNAAVKPYQDITTAENKRADTEKQISDMTSQLAGLKQQADVVNNQIQGLQDGINQGSIQGPAADQAKAQIAALQNDPALKAYSDAQAKMEALKASPDNVTSNYWPQIANLANNLQWVNGAETSYQQLVDAINAQLGKLGSIGAPTLSYGPSAMAAPKAGAPIGVPVSPQQAGKIASLGTEVGTVGAAGIGEAAGIGAAQAASAADLAAAMGTTPEVAAALQAGEAGASSTLAPAAISALQTAGPAAIAAYGASNIVQNSLKNPLQSGLMTLANTGLSLATLSLPPQIFTSIGKDINKVFKSIGDFFGGLF